VIVWTIPGLIAAAGRGAYARYMRTELVHRTVSRRHDCPQTRWRGRLNGGVVPLPSTQSVMCGVGAMMRTIDYQERIVECRRQSETAPNAQARIIWKRMEEFWRQRSSVTRPSQQPDATRVLSKVPSLPRA